MRPAAFLPRTRRSRTTRRVGAAVLALPLTAALVVPSVSVAGAQTLPGSSGSSGTPGSSRGSGPGSGTNYLDPGTVPQRSPQKVEKQVLKGLPAGVSVDRVEWISDRWVNVYINSRAMPAGPVKVQILLARDWYSQPSKTFPSVWALDVLREGWRTTDKRAIVGLSMGGTAAVNLAERHPDMFSFVGSFSGYLDTTSFGMPQAINYATHDGGGYDAEAMWGPYGSQDWIDHDPKLGIEALRGKTVYVSAGNGNAGRYDTQGVIPGLPANMAAFGLEVMSRLTTQTFVARALTAGVRPITMYRPSGTHDWPYWQFEMTQAWPYIADSLALPESDRGATCVPGGAIGEGLRTRAEAGQQLGTCTSGEYDGPRGGKIQDFRGGRAFWTPQTGAHYTWGRIGARYGELGGPESWLGYPTSEEIPLVEGGRLVTFEHGNIYWTPQTGAQAVKPDMLEAWGRTGWEKGPLGYPTDQEQDNAGGAVQQFSNGVVTRDPKGATQYVQGLIAKKYVEAGGPGGGLGWPLSGERDVRGGKMSEFENGYIYWSPTTGAHIIRRGPIFDAWGREGWETGRYGFPTEDQKAADGGEQVVFQHGTISVVGGRVRM
ncbi:alpha/beta hydrolase-fold protein [Corynebacterium bovis]|uniref:alpha/beta hydrolase-fold protein n=1 Tax=Corynebacterium bovis TaxID=36808 RepID=UPI00313A4425